MELSEAPRGCFVYVLFALSNLNGYKYMFFSFCDPWEMPSGLALRSPVGTKMAQNIDQVAPKWLHYFMFDAVASLRSLNRVLPRHPPMPRVLIFSDFQWLLAPLLAINCGIRQKRLSHRRICPPNRQESLPSISAKNPPRTIRVNDGTDTPSIITFTRHNLQS